MFLRYLLTILLLVWQGIALADSGSSDPFSGTYTDGSSELTLSKSAPNSWKGSMSQNGEKYQFTAQKEGKQLRCHAVMYGEAVEFTLYKDKGQLILWDGFENQLLTRVGQPAPSFEEQEFQGLLEPFPETSQISEPKAEPVKTLTPDESQKADDTVKSRGKPEKVSNTRKQKFFRGKYHALLISIEEYSPTSKWPSLNTPHEDAGVLKNTLEEGYNFNVTWLKDKKASYENVKNVIEETIDSVGQDDMLLIYYAGHGSWDGRINRNNPNKRIKKQYDSCWVLYDSNTPGEGSCRDALSFKTIREIIEDSKAKHTLLISDSCFSGELTNTRGMTRTNAPKMTNEQKYYQNLLQYPSNRLMSSGEGQKRVNDGSGHSPFAAALLNALQQNNGYLSGSDINQKVKKHYKNSGIQNDSKYGSLKSVEGGEFVFIRKELHKKD